MCMRYVQYTDLLLKFLRNCPPNFSFTLRFVIAFNNMTSIFIQHNFNLPLLLQMQRNGF